MKRTHIYWLFCFFIFVLFSCDKKDYSEIDSHYNNLFESAAIEWNNLNIEKSSSLLLEVISIANDVSQNKQNQRIHLKALIYLGDIFLRVGEKKLAYKEFEKALKLAEKYNDELYQVQAMLNIAGLEEDPEEVEEILRKTTHKFGSNANNKYALDQIKYALGLLYSKNNRVEDAIFIFNELLKEDYPDEVKSVFFKGLAISYRNKGSFEFAFENFDKALELSEAGISTNKYDVLKLNLLLEKADLYLKVKKYDELKQLIEDIKPSIDTISDINLKKRTNQFQLKIFNHSKNVDGKIKVLSELLLLNDQIYKKSNAALGSMTVHLESYKHKKEAEFHKTQYKYLKMCLSLTTLLFILGLLSLYLFHRIYKKQTQLQLFEKEQAFKDLQNENALDSMNAYMNGQEEERKQYAAQLHDRLGANLAAVNMHLSLLKKDVPEKKYEHISGMLKNVITETRDISHNIMPPLLVNQGVIAAITEKALEWNCPALQFEVESNIEKVVLEDNLEIALYRGILECMNNIIKSANASKAQIIFQQLENNTLHITIKDNGKGFDVGIIERGEGGLGINGVKNRIKYFKGHFNIQSEIGEGTIVEISVPAMKMKQTA